jgi:hypothetical protein
MKERQTAREETKQTNKFIREKEVKNMFEAIRNIVIRKEVIIDVKPCSFISFYEGFL